MISFTVLSNGLIISHNSNIFVG
ncbi:MAG: hypothetical protein EBS98_09215 [Chitinophagia bacterium]|nr:hypothetical protein [Chitinophagia bacterium]